VTPARNKPSGPGTLGANGGGAIVGFAHGRGWSRSNVREVRPIVIGPQGLVEFHVVESGPGGIYDWQIWQPDDAPLGQNWSVGNNLLFYGPPIASWDKAWSGHAGSESGTGTGDGRVELLDDAKLVVAVLATSAEAGGGGWTMAWHETSPGFSGLRVTASSSSTSAQCTFAPYAGAWSYIKVWNGGPTPFLWHGPNPLYYQP
jgi:hypothetical protein